MELAELTELPRPVRLGLQELREALGRLYGDRLAGLFLYGSYARGTAHADSDVDVLVVLHGEVKAGREISRVSAVVSDICLRHDLLIAMAPVSRETLDTRNDPFLANVREERVAI